MVHFCKKSDFTAIEETEFLQNQIVARIVARGWTLYESQLLWLFVGIHQPSKSEFLRFNHRQWRQWWWWATAYSFLVLSAGEILLT